MTRFAGEALSCLRSERLVFADLDFTLEPGEALVLRGPNGSGKSSLLRLMAGLIPPFDGRLLRDGAPVDDDPEAHRGTLAYLGHRDAVKPALTLRENVSFWAALARRPGDVDAALAAFDLVELADTPGRFLSSGQGRRAALARLIAAPAALWLLDEPTVGLDAAAVGALEGLIAQHRAQGGVVVLSTHVGLAVPGERALDMRAFAPPRPPDDPEPLV